MRFLADENIDRQIVERLREEGHTVLYIAEQAPGISDDTVLESSNRAEAILLTADKDFGELVFRQRQVAKGVILIRLAGFAPSRKAEFVAIAVRDHSNEFMDSFAVITPGVVRIRRQGESAQGS